MNEKKYYIAYGSNLSVEQMAQRCPDARIVGQAVLEDWELAFHGCAHIPADKGKEHAGSVWEISAAGEKNLDIYEGYPNFYRKENMTVEVVSKDAEPMTVTAMVYIMEMTPTASGCRAGTTIGSFTMAIRHFISRCTFWKVH